MTEKELELDSTEIVEGSETPDEKAPEKAVDAADKATEATKDAKKRKGDKNADEKSDLENKAEDKGTTMESYSSELGELVESEATLSEEFKQKTAVIFEAALKTKLSEEIDRLEENYAVQLEEETTAYKAEISEKVDSYITYVAEKWLEENKLAVENGLRTEIAENFMTKLKDVFTESYISVPAEKEDLVDGLVEQVETLEAQVNKSTKEQMAVSEELKSLKRELIIRESAKDLADTQAEKLNELVEDIGFTDEVEFAEKVNTIKESFFTKSVAKEVVVEEDLTEEVEVSSSMKAYISALKK